ncbi:DNA-dependent protein kinase catalytic subunit [Manduca sexta]|uniref:DNA-dependent protein kinase catalytic subunit n=1 Tax=Manduca sexta TaxID=7130 RepID=UPI00188E2139|nr:DNA-dependent protein kinase catalytic subunit [Manduca sexta]
MHHDNTRSLLASAIKLRFIVRYEGKPLLEPDKPVLECALPRLQPFAKCAALQWAGPARWAGRAGAAGRAGRADMFRRCLQLLCDPHHTLASYCRELAHALLQNDSALWDKTFTIMSEKLFENPYLGTDFLRLGKYKKTLYEIKHYDAMDNNKKLKILKELEGLLQRPPQKTLRLSQLCPALAARDVRHDPDLAELLDLPKGLSVVSFDEQVCVMTQSVRRPCVVAAALSDGSRRRFLHKRGDRPRLDAAVLHAAEALLPGLATYMVKPLSEDCALIEYLEDHIQLDSLIAESCDLSQMNVPRDDEELILRPAAAALHAFHARCDAAPAHALRKSLEKRSSSLEDFVRKKARFLETVASTTLLCWLFGVGDRHTQNVLVGAAGGVACVDWADALRHGAAELPPARLTRTVLAALDARLLESRLQQQLSELRDSATINIEVIKFAFTWTEEKVIQKLKYVEGFLNGKYLPHHVTKMALREQGGKHFTKYIELLDEVFDDYKDREDEQYTVEEQVSCLLRQCTDPRILSVTRYGWQPWL